MACTAAEQMCSVRQSTSIPHRVSVLWLLQGPAGSERWRLTRVNFGYALGAAWSQTPDSHENRARCDGWRFRAPEPGERCGDGAARIPADFQIVSGGRSSPHRSRAEETLLR